MNVAYIRIPLTNETEEQQVFTLSNYYTIDKWFTDTASGTSIDRPQLQAMLEYVAEKDTVYIQRLSRLAGNTKDLLHLIDLLQKKNVNLIFHKEQIDSNTLDGKAKIDMLYHVLEFERDNLYEKQREGIEKAKKAGKYKGRKEIIIDYDNHPYFSKYYNAYIHREITKQRFAELLGVSRPTLDKILKEFNTTT